MTFPVKGLSFLGGGESVTNKTPHLHIILSDSDEDGNCLVVSLTTWREDDNGKPFRGQDKSCILDAGDHPFIKHRSWIYYAKARSLPCNEIYNRIMDKTFERQAALKDDVLLLIQEGARKSKFLPGEMRRFFNFFSSQ
jgi:hypothetical protein